MKSSPSYPHKFLFLLTQNLRCRCSSNFPYFAHSLSEAFIKVLAHKNCCYDFILLYCSGKRKRLSVIIENNGLQAITWVKNGGKISLNLLAEPGHIGYTAFKSIHSFAFLPYRTLWNRLTACSMPLCLRQRESPQSESENMGTFEEKSAYWVEGCSQVFYPLFMH